MISLDHKPMTGAMIDSHSRNWASFDLHVADRFNSTAQLRREDPGAFPSQRITLDLLLVDRSVLRALVAKDYHATKSSEWANKFTDEERHGIYGEMRDIAEQLSRDHKFENAEKLNTQQTQLRALLSQAIQAHDIKQQDLTYILRMHDLDEDATRVNQCFNLYSHTFTPTHNFELAAPGPTQRRRALGPTVLRSAF